MTPHEGRELLRGALFILALALGMAIICGLFVLLEYA